MKQRLISFAVMLLAILPIAATHSVNSIPNVHVADRTRYVSNPDGILSASTVAALDTTLARVWRDTSAEVVVVIADQLDSDIDDFATRLFSQWGIGKKDNDNGLLLIISRDDREAVIRTGYGMEGVVPDVIAGRVIRMMYPDFRNGDYDAGVTKATNELARIITTPGATEELMSKYANDRIDNSINTRDFFKIWLTVGEIMAVALFAMFLWTVIKTRRLDRYERYQQLDRLKLPGIIMSILGLGIPLIALLFIWIRMRRLRLKKRKCPNCGNKMHRLDEKSDNAYLTHTQDVEEQLNSVDYDVWLCDHCGETDILPFINKASTYTVCPRCGARACSLQSNRVVVQPTEYREGQGVKEYVCRACGNHNGRPYSIPKIIIPPIIINGGGGNGFGGGGGFGGGSFGGGMTGGGGARGGW